MELARTQLSLLTERTRPSVTLRPKSRTRRLSTRKQLGGSRRPLFARLERRMIERITPQTREVIRSRARSRHRTLMATKAQFDKRAANDRSSIKPRALKRTALRAHVTRGMSQ